jgi:hypothetical protein
MAKGDKELSANLKDIESIARCLRQFTDKVARRRAAEILEALATCLKSSPSTGQPGERE